MSSISPESLHPALWRASQLANASVRCIESGHQLLKAQLPGGGWPMSAQTDLLVQQPGIGELRLLAPALRWVAKRKIVLISPPHSPQITSLAALGLAPEDVIWIRPTTSSDSFWSAEQVLRSGSCGALLFWSAHARSESLRRLNLAAQAGETLFFMVRPLSAARDPSPAPLRIELRPAGDGIEMTFVKRRGSQADRPLVVPLPSITPTRIPFVPLRTPTPSRKNTVDVDLSENRLAMVENHP